MWPFWASVQSFKPRKVFFSLLSVVFLYSLILYTANRLDENELTQFFELSWKGRLYTC